MLRSLVPTLAVLGVTWVTGCSAGSPNASASNRGGNAGVAGDG